MTAFQRFLINIWRLRITHPQQDILLHADDVDAAFRRILYAPDMAIVFAYVFGPYVIVPVGMVFGARSAPSFFSMASDICADIATTGDLHMDQPLHSLTQNVMLPEPPISQDLTPAIPDAKNLPLSLSSNKRILTATVSLTIMLSARSRLESSSRSNRVFSPHLFCFDGLRMIAGGVALRLITGIHRSASSCSSWAI
jgi:hypothetical protein